MTYDFTTILPRQGRDALAVDGLGIHPFAPKAPQDGFDAIPMWVADMNYPTFPGITEAMTRRIEHPSFGYFSPRTEYFDAIRWWQQQCHGVEGLEDLHIGYENGVLGGVVSALNALCAPGAPVLVHSPTYIGFTNCLKDRYRIVHSPLALDDNGIWRMDFEDMEKKIVENHIHTAIFCSPHNPCGRVWERWELEQVMDLFRRHQVYVISDEIWSDLILGPNRHIPTQSVSEDARRRTIAFYAPSKTFNLAGLVGSYHIVYDDWLRDRLRQEGSLSHYNSMNVLSMHTLIGAYSDAGRAWTDQLCAVLKGNVDYALDFFAAHFPGVTAARPQGTYMLFGDCSDWCRKHGKTIDDVLEAAWAVGVAIQDGRAFYGPCHFRMNLALPLSRVQEAMERLQTYVFVD